MKKSVKTMIENECEKFCGVYEITDEKKRARLVKLAKESYKRTPAKEKAKWTLESILKLGL
jgi:hypothetical protein